MSNFDEDIKRTLDGMSAEITPEGRQWTPLQRRIRRAHTLRMTAGAMVLVAVVSTAAAVVPRLGRSNQHPAGPVPTVSETPTPEPTGEAVDATQASPRRVVFADRSHGWAAGKALLGTSDGGVTWTKQLDEPVTWLDAADADHAWAVTANGTLMWTGDGGSHWSVAMSAPTDLVAADFADAQHGWVLRKDGQLSVFGNDASSEWAPVRYGVRAMCVSDGGHGFVATSSEILATDDDGASWRAVLTPLSDRQEVTVLRCSADRTLGILGTGGAAAGSQAYAVYMAIAGGSARMVAGDHMTDDRSVVPTISNYVGPVDVLKGAMLAFGTCPACGRGTVALTIIPRYTPPGSNLARQDAPELEGKGLVAMSFVDSQHGWVLTGGDKGRIYGTADGGKSWSLLFESAELGSY